MKLRRQNSTPCTSVWEASVVLPCSRTPAGRGDQVADEGALRRLSSEPCDSGMGCLPPIEMVLGPGGRYVAVETPVLGIAEVFGHLLVQRRLQHRLGELLEQPVQAGQG